MGREIRMVPPDWEHTKRENGDGFQPMHDATFEEAAAEWKDEFAKWESGERPDYCSAKSAHLEYWEWNGDPPDRKYYRPNWPDGAATHCQLYETVSEGTPVSPHFATPEELARYLADNGDYWYQADQEEGRSTFRSKPSYEQALAMIQRGFAFSMMVEVTDNGARMFQPHEQAEHFASQKTD